MLRLLLTGLILSLLAVGCSLGGQTLRDAYQISAVIGIPGGGVYGEDEKDLDSLRVMTFNIHHGSGRDGKFDLDRIAETIRAADADIVGLQEVDKHYGFRSQNLDVASELANRLGMYYAFGPALKRVSFSSEYDAGYFGNAVLSRYPITSAENHILERQGTSENRAFLHAEVEVGGRKVNFVVTHLGLNENERAAHVEEIMNYLGGLPDPRFLVGDWNATPDKPEVQRVVEDMIDTADAAGQDTDYTFDYKSPNPGVPNVRIDYVFVSGVEVKESSVLVTDASDHWPVIAVVGLLTASQNEGGEM